jgi:hypothetical protein
MRELAELARGLINNVFDHRGGGRRLDRELFSHHKNCGFRSEDTARARRRAWVGVLEIHPSMGGQVKILDTHHSFMQCGI